MPSQGRPGSNVKRTTEMKVCLLNKVCLFLSLNACPVIRHKLLWQCIVGHIALNKSLVLHSRNLTTKVVSYKTKYIFNKQISCFRASVQ